MTAVALASLEWTLPRSISYTLLKIHCVVSLWETPSSTSSQHHNSSQVSLSFYQLSHSLGFLLFNHQESGKAPLWTRLVMPAATPATCHPLCALRSLFPLALHDFPTSLCPHVSLLRAGKAAEGSSTPLPLLCQCFCQVTIP